MGSLTPQGAMRVATSYNYKMNWPNGFWFTEMNCDETNLAVKPSGEACRQEHRCKLIDCEFSGHVQDVVALHKIKTLYNK